LNRRQDKFFKLDTQWNFLDVQQIGIAGRHKGVSPTLRMAVKAQNREPIYDSRFNGARC
jgi:hypothetical protein